jgi:uncharacterized membrane protein
MSDTRSAINKFRNIGLLRNKLWAYPLMIVTLAVFVCYQIYRFALSHSVLMILLTLFDGRNANALLGCIAYSVADNWR